MTKTVEFRPTIKAVKMNKGGKQEVVLSIDNGSLGGKFESLSQLIGEAVNVVIQPSVISYRIPYDRETKKAQVNYILDPSSGDMTEVREEQLALDEFGANTYWQDFTVELDDVDQYIKHSNSLQLPGHIELNPREILDMMENGNSYADIAEELEVKEAAVVADLEKARLYFAPYAAAWIAAKE